MKVVLVESVEQAQADNNGNPKRALTRQADENERYSSIER